MMGEQNATGMLETTLRSRFVPATNLKGDVAGANWSFLLPSLQRETIVYLGVPRPAALATLSRLAQKVVVVGPNGRALRKTTEAGRRLGLDRVRPVVADSRGQLPLPSAGVDLAVVADPRAVRKLQRVEAFRRELARVLKPNGLLYLDLGQRLGWPTARRVAAYLAEHVGMLQLFRTTPCVGEMRTAVPIGDEATVGRFLRRELNNPPATRSPWGRAGRLVHGHLPFRPLTPRYAALAGSATNAPGPRPPKYLCSIAEAAGVPIEQDAWGLWACGEYESRKVLFYLFDRGTGQLKHVVKITRGPAHNARLENERRALALLHQEGLSDVDRSPRVAFFGHHGGLAILGETAIRGVPFRQATAATADCRCARDAIGWLTSLGVASADRGAATPAEVARILETLFRRFLDVYRLAPEHREYLAERIAAVADSRGSFPAVFQHGDPGLWNVLVTADGKAAFLDWEAAEPRGIPLWDLFYFLRSYSVCVARRAGTRSSLRGFARQFLADSSLSPLLCESAARYCELLEIPSRLAEGLFYTCWMHRALKEATRLRRTKLDAGHYVSLLRLCIDHRGAPALRRLFSHRLNTHFPAVALPSR